MLGEFDKEMLGVTLEQGEIGLITQPDQQLSEIDFDDSQRKIGYNGHSGLSCAKGCWVVPQSLHILRSLSSSLQLM